MAQFTKELRQQIVREFAIRHNGTYNPVLFVEEVRRTGPSHPAYEWFEWDNETAARNHQVWQAREFAIGLKVSFQVEEVGRKGAIKVKTAEMPLVLSPMEGRRDGGGYLLSDPSNADHQVELCKQAATSLKTWLNRYEASLIFVDAPPDLVLRLIKSLEAAQPAQLAAAE